jgi:hypothetical protein
MKELDEMQKAINCLALELPEPVYDDVSRRWKALREKIKQLEAIDAPVDPLVGPFSPGVFANPPV